jgi:hypothetical protein
MKQNLEMKQDRPPAGLAAQTGPEPVRRSLVVIITAILLGVCVWAGLSVWKRPGEAVAPQQTTAAKGKAAVQNPEMVAPDASASVPETRAHLVVEPAPVLTAPPALAPAPTVSRPEPSVYTRQLVAALTNLDFKAGPLTPEKAAEWRQALQQLTQQGAAAVPAIREFLERNRDIDFTAANAGGALGEPSLRFALFDALKQIGGPEAQALAAQTLQSTADPREIALLAKNLDQQAPDQYRQAAVDAARAALVMAAEGKLGGRDVGPLFGVLQQYGGADVVPDLERATGQWRYYAAIALAGLPDGAGVPSLIQMVEDPNGAAKGGRQAALQMLAEVSPQYPAASAALLEQAKLNQIPNATWINISEVLAGHSYQIGGPEADSAGAASGSNIKSYHLEFGNQNFFSSPNSTVLNTDQINQRVSLIDQLLAVNSNATATELLQRSRASLVALLPK